jgi:hypothetical protein
VQFFYFFLQKFFQANFSVQHAPEILTVRQNNYFIRILLKQNGDVAGPAIDGEEHPHCLVSRTKYLPEQTIYLSDIRNGFSPPAFGYEMSGVQYESPVDLLPSSISCKTFLD